MSSSNRSKYAIWEYFAFNCLLSSLWKHNIMCFNKNSISKLCQMQYLPSVQPFHAIAYPIDPMLALDIR